MQTEVELLESLARHRASIEQVNHAIHGLLLRLNTARSAVAGAGIALIGLLAASLEAQIGALTGTGCVAQCIAGAIGGAWIGHCRPGAVAGMLGYGLPQCAVFIALLIAGLVGFQLFIAMWIWGGWVIAGGFLALALDLDEQASVQRTS